MARLQEILVSTRVDAQPEQGRREAETPLSRDVHRILVDALADALVSDYRQTAEAPAASSREKDHKRRKESA